MSSGAVPAIQYSGPTISPEVDWEVRRHLQILYQKIANHVQGISLLAQKVNALKASSTTTITQGGSGGSSVPISLGGVNNQSGVTAYTTTQGDDGVVLLLNDASPVAVTLNSAVSPPYYLTVTNFGAGTATLTPSTGTIDGVGSFSLTQDGFSVVVFDGTNWWATAVIPPSAYTPSGGNTGARPGSPTLYQTYFDTTLGLPIWWSGANWVNAAGVIS